MVSIWARVHVLLAVPTWTEGWYSNRAEEKEPLWQVQRCTEPLWLQQMAAFSFFSCVVEEPRAADVLRQIYENKHLALLARGTYGYCLGVQHIHISHTLPTVCSTSQWQIHWYSKHQPTTLSMFIFHSKNTLRNPKQTGFYYSYKRRRVKEISIIFTAKNDQR